VITASDLGHSRISPSGWTSSDRGYLRVGGRWGRRCGRCRRGLGMNRTYLPRSAVQNHSAYVDKLAGIGNDSRQAKSLLYNLLWLLTMVQWVSSTSAFYHPSSCSFSSHRHNLMDRPHSTRHQASSIHSGQSALEGYSRLHL
jgi:hypothetical protein